MVIGRGCLRGCRSLVLCFAESPPRHHFKFVQSPSNFYTNLKVKHEILLHIVGTSAFLKIYGFQVCRKVLSSVVVKQQLFGDT